MPGTLLGLMFVWDNSVHHPVLQFWWVPLVLAYCVFLKRALSREYACRHAALGVVTGTLALGALCIFAFNDTVTALLWGAWLLALGLVWNYLFHAGPTESGRLRTIGLLVAVSLLLLPVSVNRVSIILPSLSGQTHFTLQPEPGRITIPGAHHYQSIVNYEEQRIQLSAQNYFTLDDNDMYLQLENDQDGVRFVIQDIIYEHAIGLFKLSILKLRDAGLREIPLHPQSDPVNMSHPPSGGIRLTDLAIGDRLWLTLPGTKPGLVTVQQHLGIVGVRLLFWLVLCWGLNLFRPRRTVTAEAAR